MAGGPGPNDRSKPCRGVPPILALGDRGYRYAATGANGQITQYVYDAEGQRVAKGTIATWPGSGNTCAAPVAPAFTATNVYLRGQQGNQDTEIDGQGNWLHTNVFADGALTATSANAGPAGQWNPALHYDYTNWVGTKRVQLNSAGQVEQYWRSDPFGNYLTAYPSRLRPGRHRAYVHRQRTGYRIR